MFSKRREERSEWIQSFATMGIDEDKLMKMSESEFQNTKDYLISVGETPGKQHEDDAEFDRKLLEEIMKKKKSPKAQKNIPETQQRNVSGAQQRNVSAPAEESEKVKLIKEQDQEYEELVKQQQQKKESEKKEEIIQKEEKKESLLLPVPPEPKEGVSIAVVIGTTNKRIMRKFELNDSIAVVYSWTKREIMKLSGTSEVPFIVLKQATGELLKENQTLTLESEGIKRNTLLNCQIL